MKLRDEMLTDIAAHLAKNKMLTVEDRAEVLARLAVTPPKIPLTPRRRNL